MQIKDKVLDVPVIQGGMGVGVSLSSLAGAVAANGACGMPILIQCLKLMKEQDDFESYLIMTDSAKLTLEHETKMKIEESIVEMLKTVYDPEIPVNVYDLGLIYKIDLQDDGEVVIFTHSSIDLLFKGIYKIGCYIFTVDKPARIVNIPE